VLGAFDLVLLGIGGIIGAGVFVLTGATARGKRRCLGAALTSERSAFSLRALA
jgi:amino acid transporter